MCQCWEESEETELKKKSDALRALVGDFPFATVTFPAYQFRHRMDYSLRGGRWGLLDANQNTTTTHNCLIVSEKIAAASRKLFAYPWPTSTPITNTESQNMPRATLRLREGPRGEIGGWLDLSHQEFLFLREEEQALHFLLNDLRLTQLEIGQKRKPLLYIDGKFQLSKQHHYPWWASDGTPLLCRIGGFSQPSLTSNAKLVHLISEILIEATQTKHCKHYLEWGAGVGNYAAAARAHFQKLSLIENDPIALPALLRNVASWQDSKNIDHASMDSEKISADKIQVFSKLQRAIVRLQQSPADKICALVNPPASGLGPALGSVLTPCAEPQPQAPLAELLAGGSCDVLIYISCNSQSWNEDRKLIAKFLPLTKLTLFNQFPRTHHFELISLFAR